ncbi:MAG TPA: SDR family NAD(P)-dependent oxidoreductase, partial [Thermoanaerobaculia bacterium]|nr:SDR family NAD(P)-dependent oxidoreductase [Thermoanaerobaculia bacterium]
KDLSVRHGVRAKALLLDALAFETHDAFYEECFSLAGDASLGVVLFIGYLGDAKKAYREFDEARRILDANLLAGVSLFGRAALELERRGDGFLCGVSSVAGDRGRMSNALYGASKAGLSTYLSGLRNRLHHSGVAVVTVKPGFVDTAMTFGLPGMFLVASPESVGLAIADACEKKRDVVYVPWFWRWVMLLIRLLPEPVFKRLKL